MGQKGVGSRGVILPQRIRVSAAEAAFLYDFDRSGNGCREGRQSWLVQTAGV